MPATCYTFAEAQATLFGPAALPAELVLLDLNLGGTDPAVDGGLALAWQLGQQGSPPFLFLTAYADLDTIRQATQLGPSGYLIKPASAPALFAAIQLALAHAAAARPASLTAEPLPALPFFFIKLGGRTHKLHWAEVQRLETTKN